MSIHNEAQIETYLKQIANGNIKNCTLKILKLLKDQYPAGKIRTFIAANVGVKEGTASARLSDLQDIGIVYTDEKLSFDDSANSIFEYVADPEKRKKYARERLRNKYLIWKKRSETIFKDFVEHIVEKDYPGE